MKKIFLSFENANQISRRGYAPKIQSRRLGLRSFQNVAYKSDGGEGEGEDPLEKQLKELKTKLDSSLTEKSKKEIGEQFTAFEAKMKKASDDERAAIQKQYNDLKSQFDDFNKKAAEVLKFGGPQKEKSFSEVLKEGVEEGVKAFKEKGGMQEIQLKTAITGSNFTNDTTGNTRVIGEYREVGINKAPKRSPFMRSLAFNGTTSSDTVSWTEKVSESGNPIALAELDAYPEETSSYQQFSTAVKKIGGMTKVSEEKLADVEWMMNEIQSELLQRHDLVVDTQLLSGTGTGNNLKGVLQYAPAFAAGDFALKVVNPNQADVLRVAYNQIIIALFQPTFVAMHPTDITFMELEKDATTSQYVLPPFVSANGMTVKGMPVVENTGVTAGTFLMGDGSRLGVFAKGGAVLEIGRDGNDFSTDQVTVKLRERLAARIKGRDVNAFVQGTFSTAITAITKP